MTGEPREGSDRGRKAAALSTQVVTLGMSACRHLSTASVAGELVRISRAIQTAPREAERTRRACGIRTR